MQRKILTMKKHTLQSLLNKYGYAVIQLPSDISKQFKALENLNSICEEHSITLIISGTTCKLLPSFNYIKANPETYTGLDQIKSEVIPYEQIKFQFS